MYDYSSLLGGGTFVVTKWKYFCCVFGFHCPFEGVLLCFSWPFEYDFISVSATFFVLMEVLLCLVLFSGENIFVVPLLMLLISRNTFFVALVVVVCYCEDVFVVYIFLWRNALFAFCWHFFNILFEVFWYFCVL